MIQDAYSWRDLGCIVVCGGVIVWWKNYSFLQQTKHTLGFQPQKGSRMLFCFSFFNFTPSHHDSTQQLRHFTCTQLICMQHLRLSVFGLSSHRKLNVATDAIVKFVRVRKLNVPKLRAGNFCSWPNLWSSRLHKINSRASRKRLIRYRYFFIIDKYFTVYC